MATLKTRRLAFFATKNAGTAPLVAEGQKRIVELPSAPFLTDPGARRADAQAEAA